MKAYGLNDKLKINLVDNHPQKGWINWWEVELGSVKKKSARQKAKKEIRTELNYL